MIKYFNKIIILFFINSFCVIVTLMRMTIVQTSISITTFMISSIIAKIFFQCIFQSQMSILFSTFSFLLMPASLASSSSTRMAILLVNSVTESTTAFTFSIDVKFALQYFLLFFSFIYLLFTFFITTILFSSGSTSFDYYLACASCFVISLSLFNSSQWFFTVPL